MNKPKKPGLILIVDDVASNLKVLFTYLASAGFEVLVAQDGESALEKAEYVLPDLILLDIVMPHLDGFEVCRQLQAKASTKDIHDLEGYRVELSERMGKMSWETTDVLAFSRNCPNSPTISNSIPRGILPRQRI